MSFCESVCKYIDSGRFQTSLKTACEELKTQSTARNKHHQLAQQLHDMFSCDNVAQLSCNQMCTDLQPLMQSGRFEEMAAYFCDNTVLKREEQHTVGRACQSLQNSEPFQAMCKSIEKIEDPKECQQYVQDAKAAYLMMQNLGWEGRAHQA